MLSKYVCSLEAVAQRLGVEDTIELLEYALPRIAKRQEEMQKCFLEEDWDAAAKCAHMIVGSVHLYGSERLEILLRQVKQAADGTVDKASLQYELLAEFDRVAQAVNVWLALHAHT